MGFCFVISRFLFEVADVRTTPHLACGACVGLAWSIVQKFGGTAVTLTRNSIEHVWKREDFILFGLAAVFVLIVLVVRIHELCRRRDDMLKTIKRDFGVQISVVGIF